MKNNKKIFIILAIIIIAAFLVIFFINNFFGISDFSKKNETGKEDLLFINKTTFEEREDIIKNYIANKFNVSTDLVVALIARESESHINGIFIISKQEDDVRTGYFFGAIEKTINMVWAEEDFPDCAIIKKHGFPREMAPDCF